MANTENINISSEEFTTKADERLCKLTLTKPFEYEGKVYESLSFDFEALTGNDFLKIEQEMNMQGMAVVSPEYSTAFIDRMAVRASREKITLDMIEALPLKDFAALRGLGRSFLTA